MMVAYEAAPTHAACMRRLLPAVTLVIVLAAGHTSAVAGGTPPDPPVESSTVLAVQKVGAAVVAPDTGNVYVTAPLDNEVLALAPDGHLLSTVSIPDPEGIAVQPGTGDVWVSEGGADALVWFDQSTFTVSAGQSLGAGADCPSALYATASTIWVAVTCGKVTYGTGVAAYQPSTQTVTDPAQYVPAPILFAPSSSAGSVYVGDGNVQVDELDISDPNAGAAEIRHSISSPGSCDHIASLAFDATADEVVLACGYPYQFVRLAADLTVTGGYPAATYPSAVSTANGYVFAGMSTGGLDGYQMDVFPSAGPARIEEFSVADPAYEFVQATAVSADAGTAYLFSTGPLSSPGVLESVITHPTTPAGQVSAAPATAPLAGKPVQFSGGLALSDQASPGVTVLTASRHNPDGSTTPLPDVTTSAVGAFSFTDTPVAPGQTTWTIGYAGDSTHAPGAAVVPRTVVLPTPALTLTARPATDTYGSADTLTARLSGHGSNTHVALYAGTMLRATATVTAGGVATFSVKPAATTAYHVAYTGDATYAPATSKAITVKVAWRVVESTPGAYAVKSGVHRFHYRAACVSTHRTGCPTFGAAVSPNGSGKTVTLQAQERVGGRWYSLFDRDVRLSKAGRCSLTISYATRAVIGHLLRARLAPIAAKGGLVAVTPPWVEMTVTS